MDFNKRKYLFSSCVETYAKSVEIHIDKENKENII